MNDDNVVCVYGAVGRYDEFRETRKNLRELIHTYQNTKRRKEESRKEGILFLNLFSTLSISSTLRFNVDEEGKIRISGDLLGEALEGVEVERLRECEVCRRIFWAGRLDQHTDATPCRNILRKRRWRSNSNKRQYQEKRNKRRRKAKEATNKNLSVPLLRKRI